MEINFENIFFGILSWISEIIIIMAAFGNFIDHSLIAGTILLIIVLFILPPSSRFLKEKLNLDLSRGIDITLFI